MNKKSEKTCFFSESMFSIPLKILLLSLFVFATIVHANASTYSRETKFTFELNNERVKDVFQYIENNSEFIILFNEKFVDLNRKVSLKVHDETVESIFNQIFFDTPNSFNIYDRQMVIMVIPMMKLPEANLIKEEIGPVDKKLEQPSTKEISGKIVDEAGNPLIGVSVVLQGTTLGTITDVNGNFLLRVPLDAKVLVFSYVGMKTQEIDISDKISVNITMEEESIGMEEVVVVGYGTQRKESIVGAISQIDNQVLMESGISNVTNAIAGKLSGVLTIQSSGQPGLDHAEIVIRGLSSWNSSLPLVLVDGTERDFNDLDPNEIQTISVLKDASATAVFGARGANGVIIVTTKRGNISKPKLSFALSYGGEKAMNLPKHVDSHTVMSMMNVGLKNLQIWNEIIPDHILEEYRNSFIKLKSPSVS